MSSSSFISFCRFHLIQICKMLIDCLLLKQQISMFKSSTMILIDHLQNLLTFNFFSIKDFQWLFCVNLDKLLIKISFHSCVLVSWSMYTERVYSTFDQRFHYTIELTLILTAILTEYQSVYIALTSKIHQWKSCQWLQYLSEREIWISFLDYSRWRQQWMTWNQMNH